MAQKKIKDYKKRQELKNQIKQKANSEAGKVRKKGLVTAEACKIPLIISVPKSEAQVLKEVADDAS